MKTQIHKNASALAEATRKSLFTALAITTLVATAACSSNNDPSTEGKNVINTASLAADVSLAPTDRAKRLALAAEQLVSPTGFMYADAVLDQALALDPANLRARFWKAALGPSMSLRGIMNRIAPIARTQPQWNAAYEQAINDMKRSSPDRALVDFLLDGPQDIRDERDLQDVIASFTAKLDELRSTVKTMKNEELSITVNSEAFKKTALNEAQQSCYVERVREGVYSRKNCDLSKAYEVRLNHADFEAVQHILAGYQVYLTLLNSWNFSGVLKVAAQPGSRHEADVLAELLKNPSFGTLRAGQKLGVVPDLARDFVVGVRYAMETQSELCPKGYPTKQNRKGHLFAKGICQAPSSLLESQLRAVELMLSGTPAVINVSVNRKSIPVIANAGSFFKSPIQDLRGLLPIQKDACGRVTAMGDGKAGDLFPYGDLNLLLSEGAASKYCWPN